MSKSVSVLDIFRPEYSVKLDVCFFQFGEEVRYDKFRSLEV